MSGRTLRIKQYNPNSAVLKRTNSEALEITVISDNVSLSIVASDNGGFEILVSDNGEIDSQIVITPMAERTFSVNTVGSITNELDGRVTG